MRKPDLPILPTSARSSDVIRAINTLSRWAARLDTILLSRKDAVSVGDLTDSGSHTLDNGEITSTAINSAGVQGGQPLIFDTDPDAETGYITSTSDVKKGKWFLNEEKTIVVDERNERFGIGEDIPEGTLHVKQDNPSGMIPGFIIEQTDTDEPFVKFIGTATAATLTKSMVAAADVSAKTIAGYIQGYFEDEGNQIVDGKYYLPIYELGTGGGEGSMLGENKLTVLVNLAATGWKEVGTHEVATLTGAAIVRTTVRCVSLSPSAADTISYGIEGNTSFWIAATARNSIQVNQFWLTTTGSTGSAPLLLEGISATSHIKSATLESVDIGYQIYSTEPTQGWLEFTFWWTPISEGATLVAGIGGTL